MKRFFSLVVLLATMTVAVQAQVKFGLKGGLNLTSMKFDKSVADKSNQASFFVGPTVKFTLPVVGLGIDASALYDQRSVEVEGNKIKQQSIQIPVNLRYGIGLGSTASIFIFAGPQFGFNIGDKTDVIEIGNQAVSDWTLRSSNLSGNIGLGFMVLNHFQISANYNIAFGKTGEFNAVSEVINQAGQALNLKDNEGKMNSWQIALAYYF